MRKIQWIIILFWSPIALSIDCQSFFKGPYNHYVEDRSYEEEILFLKELIKKESDSFLLYKTLISILSDPNKDERELYTIARGQLAHISLQADKKTINGLFDLLMDNSLTYTNETERLLATLILLAPDENFKNIKKIFKYFGEKRGLAQALFLKLELWIRKKGLLLSASKEIRGGQDLSHSPEADKFAPLFYNIIKTISSAEHDKVKKSRVYRVIQYYSHYENHLKKAEKNNL